MVIAPKSQTNQSKKNNNNDTNYMEEHDLGLDDSQVKERQKIYGKNEIGKKNGKFFKLLVSNFLNPLSLVLIAVSITLYFLGDLTSSIIVFVLIILNGILGFYQEFKSEKAGEKLRKQILRLCKVKRSGIWKSLSASELVPGDLVRLEAGDMVPADIRLSYANELSIDQSSLTGESYPVEKTSCSENGSDKKDVDTDSKCLAYMGSMVSEGIGEGHVIQIGEKTSFGATAALLNHQGSQSIFEKNIENIGNNLLKIIIVSTFLIFIVNVATGKDVLSSFLFAVALAVGLVPEAMPIIITITLSNGALALSKHGVIAKRLSSIEDLGNIDVLCTDKTGTLTENMMVVHDVLNIEGKSDHSIMDYAGICVSGVGRINPYHNKEHIISNPIDHAIISWVKSPTSPNLPLLSSYRVIAVKEFNYQTRVMSVLIGESGSRNELRTLITKGSPESVIELCKLDKKSKSKITALYHSLGESGYRSIAVAIKKLNPKSSDIGGSDIQDSDIKDLEFLGIVTFFDPPKKTVREVLDIAKKLSVTLKIISGDNLNIVKYTAKSVGFEFSDEQAITGNDLESILSSSASNEEKEALLRKTIENSSIFARMNPSQKYLVVKKLKEYGHSVAFMGDGVNDAPAIKEADVGISVNNGSEVTKEAADIILLKKSLRAVILGISGGRKVFANVVKYILNTLSGNFGDLFTIGFASAFIPFIPITPVQILLSNFITDAPMVSISTDNVDDEEILKPKKWDINGLVRVASIFGLISTVFDLMVILYFIHSAQSIFQTALFVEIIISEIIVILILRSSRPFFKAEPLSFPLLMGIIATLLATIFLVYTNYGSIFGLSPIPTHQLLVLMAIILVYTACTEIVKNIYFRMFRRELVDGGALKSLRKNVTPELR